MPKPNFDDIIITNKLDFTELTYYDSGGNEIIYRYYNDFKNDIDKERFYG